MSPRAMAILAAALVLAGGCGRPLSGRVVYQADYPSYPTAAELYAKADVVVEATPKDPRIEWLYPSDQPEPAPELGVVITVYDATISKVHKGPQKAGDRIAVQQMGGELDGVIYEQPGIQPFTEGTPYLLFLATFPDAPAALLNPDQAKYTIAADGTYQAVGGNTITVTAADLKG